MNNRLFSRKDLVRLIIPLIVDQFLQVAVGLSDSIMVARLRSFLSRHGHAAHHQYLHGSRHRRRRHRRPVSRQKRSENRM